MGIQILEILKYFIIYSILGWALESIFRSICEKKLINTGFLNGPFCPIYGVGAIIMLVFLKQFEYNIFLLFIMSFVILTIWEYLVGFFLEKVFHTKYWDYSNHKINFQGRICLLNSLYWGFLGVIFICYIHPFISEKIKIVPTYIVNIFIIVTSIICLIDTIISIMKLKKLTITLANIEKLNQQIKEKLEELKHFDKQEEKSALRENIQNAIYELTNRKNRMLRRIYKRVYRLKEAFPAINSKEIAEILNKKVEVAEILNKKIEIKKHKNKRRV